MMTKEQIDQFFTTGVSGSVVSLLLRALGTLLIFLIGMQVIKIIRKVVRKSMEKAKAEAGITTFVDSFIRVALYVILVFLIASRLGVDAASIVAILGSAGVAIGLAIQGSLSNLAGGVLLLLLRPFRVGDYIIDSNGREGIVSEIQIFYTTLHTTDNKVIVLPNGNLANNCIINVTAEKTRRVDISVQISYHADLKKAKQVLLDMIKSNEYAMENKECNVFVDSLDDSGVTMGLRCWTEAQNYWKARWDITEKCKLTLDEAGIEIPYPQVDVHFPEKES